MAYDITEDFQLDISSPTANQSTSGNSSAIYDLAFNGETFIDASSPDLPYRRQTAQYQKNQSDDQSDPGEQTFTGWWLRSQNTFHLGSGSKFFEPAQDQNLRYRFQDSEGVDVWTAGEVSLLRDVDAGHKIVGAAPTHMRSINTNGMDMVLLVDDKDVDKAYPTLTVSVTQKQLTSNVAKLTSAGHPFKVGMEIVVSGVDATFNGTFEVTAVDASTFSYAKTASNVSPTATTGTVTSNVIHFIDHLTGGSDEVLAICENGLYAYWLHETSGKWTVTRKPLSGNSLDTSDELLIHQDTVAVSNGVIEWAKERLIVCVDNKVYEIYKDGTSTYKKELIYTLSNSEAYFTAIADSPSDVYLSTVRDSTYSAVLKLTVTDDKGVATALTGGRVVAEMPRGELITGMHYYLGYLLLGTTRGVRVAQILDGGGIVYGPLLFESTQPVHQFATRDRYAFCTAAIHGDTGVIRIDLGQQFDSLRFSWANDAQAVGVERDCTGVSFLGITDRVVFSAAASGTDGNLYFQNAIRLRSSGYLQTGRIRYNTLEGKYFKYIKPRAVFDGGSIGVATSYAPIVSVTDANANIDLGIPQGAAETFLDFTFTLARSATDDTAGPTFFGYQVKALPAVRRQRLIQYNLFCFDIEQDRFGNKLGYQNRAYERLSRFEDLEATSNLVTVQDFRTGETFQGLIEECSFTSVSPPGKMFSGFGGILTVTVRKIS